MFKVKITILLISILVVSTICDDESIIVKAIDEPKECTQPFEIANKVREQLELFDNVGACFYEFVNITILSNETEENVNEIIKNDCLRKDDIYDCVELIYNGHIEECTPAEIIEFKDSLLLQARNMITHICDNDGLRLRNFFNDKAPNCFIDKLDKYKDCTKNLKEQIRSTKTVAEKCDDLKTAQTCTVGALQTCEKQGASIFINELIDFVLDEHICKDKETHTGILEQKDPAANKKMCFYDINIKPVPVNNYQPRKHSKDDVRLDEIFYKI